MTSSSQQNDHHLGDDRIISAIELKSSSSRLPSHQQQRADSILSSEQTTSAIQSPTSYTSDFSQQESLTQSSTSTSTKSQYSHQTQPTLVESDENIARNGRRKDDQHRLSRDIHNNKFKTQNSWFER